MEQGCIALGRLSEGLSYRDLTNAFSRFFARLVTQQQLTPSFLRKKDIIECINSAGQATQLAVAVQAQEMAAPRGNFARFHREAANTQADTYARHGARFGLQ